MLKTSQYLYIIMNKYAFFNLYGNLVELVGNWVCTAQGGWIDWSVSGILRQESIP